MRIGVVAGEVSGDLLGAGLLSALRERFPDCRFEGIGGARMIEQGLMSWFPMERLAVMGVDLSRYREILGIRRRLVGRMLADPPDLFIGIDAPDFNLSVEHDLRRAGIPTVHYVSPSVWAWRRYRLKKIARSVDLMLVLFPFETKLYREHNIPVTYVGHPMADEIALEINQKAIRVRLRLTDPGPIIALLPGSREQELRAHATLFVRTAMWLHERHPDARFTVPFVTRQGRLIFEQAIKACSAWDVPIQRFSGHSREVMAAADVVLLASGTAALEAALLRRPMVVTYRLSAVTALMVRMFSHVTMYSLPNHLAGRMLVPELLQKNARPELLGAAIEEQLAGAGGSRLQRAYAVMHKRLRRNGSQRAAAAVATFLKSRQAP
ncbi:MAG TPA: lipid-A-disaccharide synthase [Acidiferrobacteraceae bacterium]|nr:lipid-A-disaccharide synthase [Acidiferrobacteraceae bacterium]